MPPRWISAVILLAWLASAIWLFRLEIWPSLEPSAPPPFTIDLVDEAQTERPIPWTVKLNGKEVFTAHTSVVHRSRENDFTLHASFEPRAFVQPEEVPAQIRSMNSSYRVTPEGQLLGLDVELKRQAPPCTAHLWGEVHNGQFTPNYELDLIQGTLKPVAVSSQGSVVMPLHPLNRISGLRPGQEWRVPVFDPLDDSLASITGSETRTRFLRAKIRPAEEMLAWNKVDTPCLVIDYQEESGYTEDKISAETWVRATDGLVLRQVANLSGVRWEMVRGF
jgi:hypothetical protein